MVGATAGVVALKLALFLVCRGSPSPAVQAFALDHLNDVLVNGVGLAGARARWQPLLRLLPCSSVFDSSWGAAMASSRHA